MTKAYLADVPLAAAPGESYAYQNETYAVGAYAAAMAAGASYGENLFATYADLMQARVFEPLGMISTTFSDDGRITMVVFSGELELPKLD